MHSVPHSFFQRKLCLRNRGRGLAAELGLATASAIQTTCFFEAEGVLEVVELLEAVRLVGVVVDRAEGAAPNPLARRIFSIAAQSFQGTAPLALCILRHSNQRQRGKQGKA